MRFTTAALEKAAFVPLWSEILLTAVDLYYETIRSGPLILLITGADGRDQVWRPLAEHLAAKYTVVNYDRRGYSQSIISGAQDYENRLATDADDAAALIAHLSPDLGATVVGNSSGAIVGLNVLLRHPERAQARFP